MVKVAVFDTETTGLTPGKDQIIEICLVQFDLSDDYLCANDLWYTQRIQPTVNIKPDAQAVHGIDITDLKYSPRFGEIAANLCAILDSTDVLVAHNAGFDAPMLAAELDLQGLVIPAVEIFCTKEQGRWATFSGKYPTLQELAFACGVEYDVSKAHAAEYDVQVTRDCLLAGLRRGHYSLPDGVKAPAKVENCYG